MARRRTPPPPVPDAVREAVQRTVHATLGQAQQAREETRGRAKDARTRAQAAVDDVVKGARTTRGRAQEAVEGVVKGAETVGERVREALDEARPASHDDMNELRGELRAINRRLDAIEKRLPPAEPKPRSRPAKKK
jgi:polyhydroxyalkanoate synthesis regulator phasin